MRSWKPWSKVLGTCKTLCKALPWPVGSDWCGMRAPHQRLRLTVLHNTHFPDAVHQLLGRVLVDISTILGPSLDMSLCDFVVVTSHCLHAVGTDSYQTSCCVHPWQRSSCPVLNQKDENGLQCTTEALWQLPAHIRLGLMYPAKHQRKACTHVLPPIQGTLYRGSLCPLVHS